MVETTSSIEASSASSAAMASAKVQARKRKEAYIPFDQRAPSAYYPLFPGGPCTIPTQPDAERVELQRLMAAHKWWSRFQLAKLEQVKDAIQKRTQSL